MSGGVDDKVMGRIRKLMSLANGTAEGGEHERDTAMKMALNLLAKHNLSMADLSQPAEKRMRDQAEYRSDPWVRIVGHALAELYFCGFFSTAYGSKRAFTFVGLESNVATAKEMTDWVVKSIAAESRRLATERGEVTKTFANSFRKGAASKISQRCRALRAEAERANAGQASSGTSLVLASLYDTEKNANALYITDTLGIKLVTKVISQRNTTYDGAAAGAAYGDKINLNKQIGGAPKSKVAGRIA